MLASWEGGIRGHWPLDEYVKLTEVQEEMIAVLAQVCDTKQMWDDTVTLIVYVPPAARRSTLEARFQVATITLTSHKSSRPQFRMLFSIRAPS